MENLPQDYSRIFQFQNFERTRRRILAEAAEGEEGAMVRCCVMDLYSLDFYVHIFTVLGIFGMGLEVVDAL